MALCEALLRLPDNNDESADCKAFVKRRIVKELLLRIRFIGFAILPAMLLTACGGGGGNSVSPSRSVLNSQTMAAITRAHTPPRPPAPAPHAIPDQVPNAAGRWQSVAAASPFGSNGAGTALLMTDGTVMVQDNASSWYSLAPDKTGSYLNGTWTQKASLPAGYGPLYFASAVLGDGKLVINGGEYNFFKSAESNRGAIYDPAANAWTSISAPPGWTRVGDAQSVVLAQGTYMLGNCCTDLQALLSEKSLTWKSAGGGKADGNSEEGWTLLPSGEVLTVDVGSEPNSELYNPGTRSWSSAGTVPVNLTQQFETGPEILRPNGTVFAAGASAHTAVYTIGTGSWSTGPDFPKVAGQQLDIADGPAAVLTNGNVLMAASPSVYQAPAYFYEFNGTKLVRTSGPSDATNDSSYNIRLLLLPTGQVLETDGSDTVEIYTSTGRPDLAIAPAISSVPSTLAHGNSYAISGKRFNGFSQGNAYGDDAQSATNYPLVKITNTATGHVFFARTHDHSFMGVASQATVSTTFDVPANIELGASKLVVIANGIPSPAVSVTID